MPDVLKEQIRKKYYNPDGSMKPTYRDSLRSRGWTENDIDQTEQMHIRNAAIDKEVADWQQELKRQLAEESTQKPEKNCERVGSLEVPSKPTSASNKLTHSTRAEQMAGLDVEELLSQGFLEPDDFYDPQDESNEQESSGYALADLEAPDIWF